MKHEKGVLASSSKHATQYFFNARYSHKGCGCKYSSPALGQILAQSLASIMMCTHCKRKKKLD